MDKKEYTRRDFLKLTGLGITAFAVHSFLSTTDAPPREAFRFAQLCDTQLGYGGYTHDVNTFKQAVKQINALEPDFVAICGDLVNSPDKNSFADFNKIKAELNVPSFCVPGNHDIGEEPTQASLQLYRKEIGEDYYSFEHKGYVFVMVNSQLWKTPVIDETKKHDSWLEATLKAAAKKKAPIFVISHHAFFLKTLTEDENADNLPLDKRKEILNLFKKYGVVAVLGGHTHKLFINEYKGIQLVNGETTSKNFDQRPFGFRIWNIIDPRPFKHDFIPLESY